MIDNNSYDSILSNIFNSEYLKKKIDSLALHGNEKSAELLLFHNKLKILHFPGICIENEIEWDSDPFKDRAWQFALNRFSFLKDIMHFDLKKQTDLNPVFKLILDWINKYLSTNPYSRAYSFIWHDHGTALRAENLVYFLSYIFCYRQDWAKNNITAIEEIINSIIVHSKILSSDKFYSKHTNHGLEQSRVLLLLSDVLKNDELKKLAIERIADEFEFSFTDEGVHVENSPSYHYQIFNIFLNIFYGEHIEDFLHLKEIFTNTFKKTLIFLTHILTPESKIPIIGDSTNHSISDVYSRYFSETTEYSNFLYALSGGKKGLPPSAPIAIYPKSGYVIIRDKWSKNPEFKKDFQLISKVSALSSYHYHQDEGSLIINYLGESWLVDSGLYNHNLSSPIRNYMRSRFAHNIVHFGNNNDGSSHSYRKVKKTSIVQSVLTEYVDKQDSIFINLKFCNYPKAIITRSVKFDKEKKIVTVTDDINASRWKYKKAYILWHFDSNKTISAIDYNKILATSSDTGNICQIRIESKNDLKTNVKFGKNGSEIFSLISKIKDKFEQNTLLETCITLIKGKATITSTFSFKEAVKENGCN
ncbi:MAG TPA: hypothetical protein DD381_10195 [Lentisphaeria bacterium]|nr:MAG: hypothetical protein A2X47_11970 [Lentisphaerae bacterium GWF2_38_69]HBM16695.1 hypothetical protein [Lentisphaeria bacterium]